MYFQWLTNKVQFCFKAFCSRNQKENPKRNQSMEGTRNPKGFSYLYCDILKKNTLSTTQVFKKTTTGPKEHLKS